MAEPGFADACALADEAVSALGLESLHDVEVGLADHIGGDGSLQVTVTADSEEAFAAAQRWEERVEVPAGVALSVPTWI